MKVGDLVQLSAYGKKLTCNYSQRGCLGLVTHIDVKLSIPLYAGTSMIVQWSGHKGPAFQVRRDLKYAK